MPWRETFSSFLLEPRIAAFVNRRHSICVVVFSSLTNHCHVCLFPHRIRQPFMMFTRSVILFWLYTNHVPLVHGVMNQDSHPQRDLEGCEFIQCNFDTLLAASFMSNAAQKQRIYQDCKILSVTADKNGAPRNVNVFNSSDIKGTTSDFDPDLGSPNKNCPEDQMPPFPIAHHRATCSSFKTIIARPRRMTRWVEAACTFSLRTT
jgi:hypothetical protein